MIMGHLAWLLYMLDEFLIHQVSYEYLFFIYVINEYSEKFTK